MSITTTVHLNFRGDARAALDFYRSVFGGEVVIMTYGDADGDTSGPQADQVLWGQVQSSEGFHVMAYDVQADRPFDAGQNRLYMSVRAETTDEITGYWDGLSAEGTVIVDLVPSEWSPLYGMVTDRFGITWVLDVAVAYVPS
ncbi:VOC family protein [Gordonia soli]|uniref:Glyoxalase/fosfomycin resistance/dioxygenase domain-containing protein n=1 Tax=Gordonia soli NBRC 108243 TaxID=1223545 RepID=M0QID8_9ACTN|nr:VOC family protein [Gordonia soli]GAC68313.1 hypothetical protein GS4_14_01460 [Gordonia soli NBRC 108243]